jgi:hypothetical protein
MKKMARYKYKTLAAGIGPAKNDGLEERYRAVKFLAPVPTKIRQHQQIYAFQPGYQCHRKELFGSRTIKMPYLCREESQILLDELKKTLT